MRKRENEKLAEPRMHLTLTGGLLTHTLGFPRWNFPLYIHYPCLQILPLRVSFRG